MKHFITGLKFNRNYPRLKTLSISDMISTKPNGIVKSTKAKKDIGIAYMKSWEREKELKAEGAEMLAQLLKKLDPGSDEFNRALNATEEERQSLYKKYNIVA